MGMRQPLQVLKTVSAHQVHHLGQGQTQQNDASITSGPLFPTKTPVKPITLNKKTALSVFFSICLYLSFLSRFHSLSDTHTHTHTFSHKPLSLKKT